MKDAHTSRPRILLIDNDPARIEHLENLLYRHGYRVHTFSPDELERGVDTGSVFSLVLTYLPLNPAWNAVKEIPALVLLPEEAAIPQSPRADAPAVVYLAASAGASVLLGKIAGLIGSEAEIS